MQPTPASSRRLQLASLGLLALTLSFSPLLDKLDASLSLPDFLYNGLGDLVFYGSLLVSLFLFKKLAPVTSWTMSPFKRNLLGLVGHFLLLLLWTLFAMAFLPALVNGQAVGQMLDEASSQASLWLFLFNALFIGPIREELLFRGLVFESLKTAVKPYWLSILSASLFALAHLPFDQLRGTDFLFYAVNGLIFANLYKRTDGISWPILLHILWNSFVYYMSTR